MESQENQGIADTLPTFPAFSDNADREELAVARIIRRNDNDWQRSEKMGPQGVGE